MTKYLMLMMVCVSANAFADSASVSNVSLRTDSAVAQCAAEAAVTQLLSENPFTAGEVFQKLLVSYLDGTDLIAQTADLNFMVITPATGKSDMFTLQLQSLDANGWQLLKGSTGEIYPYSSSVENFGKLIQQTGGDPIWYGNADISGCN